MTHNAQYWTGFVFGAIGGALIVGALLGLIPLVLGQYLKESKLGRVGFLASVVASFVAGVFGGVPVSLGFVVAILMRWRRNRSFPNSKSG
jgi:hypothetical protein